MSLYFCGIDISKYKHDCCVICAANQKVIAKLSFKNNRTGFEKFLSTLNSLQDPEDIRIGFESTSHYALNLELFLESSNLSFMEVNPVLISEYRKSSSLRRTKTYSVDCETIARWLMSVEYKPHTTGFYHAYSLKSLTRLRDRLVRQRSLYLVKITVVLDHTFPEFKPFFNEKFSATALYLLETYGSAQKMSRMNQASYEKLRSISRGKFSIQRFINLKELAANSVGTNNSIFDLELSSLISLYKTLQIEISKIETEIIRLVDERILQMAVLSCLNITYPSFVEIHLTFNSLSPLATEEHKSASTSWQHACTQLSFYSNLYIPLKLSMISRAITTIGLQSVLCSN